MHRNYPQVYDSQTHVPTRARRAHTPRVLHSHRDGAAIQTVVLLVTYTYIQLAMYRIAGNFRWSAIIL